MNELTRRKSEEWREKLGMVAKIGVAVILQLHIRPDLYIW